MTWRDDGYVEALQQETIILAKRVMAARSRLLLSTCFDVSPTLQDMCVRALDDSDTLQDLRVRALDDSDALQDKDFLTGASALDHSLSVISEEGALDDDEDDEDKLRVSVIERRSASYEEDQDSCDTTKEPPGRSRLGAPQGEENEAIESRVRQDGEKRNVPGNDRDSCDEPTDAEAPRSFDTTAGGATARRRLSVGEGFNVEDWRRLRESFIL